MVHDERLAGVGLCPEIRAVLAVGLAARSAGAEWLVAATMGPLVTGMSQVVAGADVSAGPAA
jgi:hypothetical protein